MLNVIFCVLNFDWSSDLENIFIQVTIVNKLEYISAYASIKLMLYATGCMFHGKPLYVAFAQKKEDRERELQLRHAQKKLDVLAGPSSTAGACPPPFIYRASGVVYHPPLGLGWSANGFASPSSVSEKIE